MGLSEPRQKGKKLSLLTVTGGIMSASLSLRARKREGCSDEDFLETTRDHEVLHVERLESKRGASSSSSSSRWPRRAASFLVSPAGKALTRAWLTLVIPQSIFYVKLVHDWLGQMAFLLTLLPIAPAIFATPAYVGVTVSLCLKLMMGVCIGQVSRAEPKGTENARFLDKDKRDD